MNAGLAPAAYLGGNDGAPDTAMRWRALAYLFLAGATIGLISVLIPGQSGNTAGLLSNIAIAYATAFTLLAGSRRLPAAWVHVVIAAGALVIARAIYLSGDTSSYYSGWYVWIALYAFYFFRRPAAVAHVAWVGVTYAGVLVVQDAGMAAVPRWITTVSSLVVAAVFVDTLVRKLRARAEGADTSASRLALAAEAIGRMSASTDREEVAQLLTGAVSGVAGAASAALRSDAGPAGSGTLIAKRVPYSPWPGAAPTQLVLRWHRPGHEPSAEVHHVIDMLIGEFASALTRIDLLDRLESAARTDPLSGLPNRRAWDDELPQQLARARRFGYDLCVAVLDLDGLKVLNDRQGHLAGDALLRATARAWSDELRAVDFLVRWGGDEFALILPGCSLEDASATLERMRSVMPDGGRTSAGLACWDGIESGGGLVARADEALYEAKRAGRDRLVLASAGPKAP